MALSVWENFEDGDVAEWNNTSNWSAVTDHAYNGSYSAHANTSTSNNDYLQGERSFGEAVTVVELYWRETSGSYGHGYQFLDSNGNRVAGAGTSNPGWMYIDGGSGIQAYSGDGYDRWVRMRLEFDYSNNQVTYTFEDQNSGTKKTYTANMDATGKVTQIQVVNTDAAEELASQSIDTGSTYHGSLDSWTDYIQYTKVATTPSLTGTLSSSATEDTVTLNLPSVDWGGEQGHYNILRGTSSGSYSEVGTASASSDSYTDSGLEYGEEYFYVVTAENSAGVSGQSNEVSATTVLPAPADIQIVDSSTEGELTVDWTPVGDASGYYVYIAESSFSDPSNAALDADVSSPPHTITGLEDGEKYFIRVSSHV